MDSSTASTTHDDTDPTIIDEVPGTTIEVIWADQECQEEFTNTLIVVDGIDPDTMQNVEFIDDENGQGAYQKYSEFFIGSERVSDLIIEKGYDFAFINFEDGGQSIEATAQILKAAIRYINARKAAAGISGDNIVIGHSMGGLTSKWALSEMARDGEDHGVSKFFSFDSPLRGAVVPLGVQLNLEYLLGLEIRAGDDVTRLRDVNQQFDVADAILNSPATQELLVFKVDVESLVQFEQRPGGGTKVQRYIPTIETAAHDLFQRRFDSLYPLDVPHIAIADGSRSVNQPDGTTDENGTIEPSGLIYSMSIDQNEWEWNWTGPVRVKFTHDATTRFAPDAYTSTTEVKVFHNGWIRIIKTNQTSSSTHADFGLPHYDLAPGSHGDDGLGELNDAGADSDELSVTLHTDHYCFVPTSSALNLPWDLTAPVGGCGPGITDCIVPDPENLLQSRFLDATRNHEHVTFTPSIAVQVLDRIPNLGQHEWSGTGLLAPVDEQYNFAAAGTERTPQEITGVRTVSAGGGFLVNRNKRIRFINDVANPDANSLHYDVLLTGGGCEEEFADITLQSGSKFIVGENNARTATVTGLAGTRVTVQNVAAIEINDKSDFLVLSNGVADDQNGGIVVNSGGVLHAKSPSWSSEVGGRVIVDGGTIRIKAGGQLRTSFNSQIIARNGGRIILEDGALVQLWGGNVNEAEGTVWIQNGGELVIEGEYTFTGDGYWQFDQGNTVSGDGALVIEGDGKQFRRMKLNKSAQVILSEGQDFEVKNAKVEYDYGSSVQILDGSAFDVSNATFNGPAATAIKTDGSARSFISSSEFLNNDKGFVLDQDGPLSELQINSSLFQSSTEYGVLFTGFSQDNFGRTPKINGCTFDGCETGVRIKGLLSASISNSTFSSSEDFQFAINANDCENLLVSNCTVSGYETEFSSTSKKGAVELDFVTARFSGGLYSANTVAIHDEFGSTLTFSNCVEVSANCYGIANSELASTTLALNGMSLLNNSIGIFGGSGTITSGAINSFQMPANADATCEVATPRLISMDNSQNITLNSNHWMDAQGATLTLPPAQNVWFCIVSGPNNWCTTTNIPTNNIQAQGCASGPCESPKTCEYYCELYPESPECYNGGGVGLPGFTATPNPSGGIVALSQLPEDGGTLNVFDARGALMKTLRLDQANFQVVNLEELPSGIYTLQLLDSNSNKQEAVRLILTK